MITLRKPLIDLGFQSTVAQGLDRFWRTHTNVKEVERLDVYEGVTQIRLALGGSVIKINEMQTLPEAPPTGFRQVAFPEPAADRRGIWHTQGFTLSAVAPERLGGAKIGIEIATPNIEAACEFYGQVLGLSEDGRHQFCLGKTRISLRVDAGASRRVDDHGPGLRYITLQVDALNDLHHALLEKGAVEHSPPVQWNETSYVSFIRDCDNNLIELSQRSDLV